MSIEVRMPGSPKSVRAVADWLDSVAERTSKLHGKLGMAASEGRSYWLGESGRAWACTTLAVRERADSLPDFLSDAVEVFRDYADGLEDIQEDFAALLFQARAVGLPVVGGTVSPPTSTLDYCPGPGSPEEDIKAYDDYVSKVESYQDLCKQVGARIGDLDEWIGENILPLVARVYRLEGLTGTASTLAQSGNQELAKGAYDWYDRFLEGNLAEWRERHDAFQDAADTFRKQLRSGNPALSAAADEADPRGMRRSIAELGEQIGDMSKLSRALSLGGTTLDLISFGKGLADGESPSSLLAELGGGALGSAGGAALFAGGPVGWVAGGAVIGGMAAGPTARWLWEAHVPRDVRKDIDGFFTDDTPRLKGFDFF
jgi:hypothetical protein